MKRLLGSLSIVTLLIAGGCGGSDAPAEAENSQPKMTVAEMENPSTLEVEISGMMCPDGCAAVVQKEIYALDGISTSSVDFNSKTGTFEYDAAIISQHEIVAAIEKVNKGAYKIERSKSSEDSEKPAVDTEAVEETTTEDEASV